MRLRIPLIIAAAILMPNFFLAGQAEAQSCQIPSGCPGYSEIQAAFPNNARVSITINTSDSAIKANADQAVADLNSGLGDVNNGITYSVGNNPPGTASSIFIDFDMTSPHGSCDGKGGALGCTTQQVYVGSTETKYATTVIYLGAQGCQTGGSEPCFDSSFPGFGSAIQGIIKHEIAHTTGVGDADGVGTLMSNRSGTNNQYGTTRVTPCDRAAVPAARRRLSNGGSVCKPK